jgi:hypothetical protein
VICSGVESDAEYVLNWFARMFQYPDTAGEVALVLRGLKGSGKGILFNSIIKAWGAHGIHIANAKHLVGNFNAHLRDCVALFADEAFFVGDRQHESVLKALVTEATLPIEGKYQNVVEVKNMLHIMMASNKDWVVPASHDERRYAVFDVADNRVGERGYFGAIAKQMENGGLAAMIYNLLHRDISAFEVRDFPHTAALEEQKKHSLDSLHSWWLAVLERGFLWKSRHGTPWFSVWHEFYTTELLQRSYLQWCDAVRPFDRKSRVDLGKMMMRIYSPSRPRAESHPVYEVDNVDVDNDLKLGDWLDRHAIVYKERPAGYTVSDLTAARIRFMEISGVVGDWGMDP